MVTHTVKVGVDIDVGISLGSQLFLAGLEKTLMSTEDIKDCLAGNQRILTTRDKSFDRII